MINAIVCGAGGRMGKRIISLMGETEGLQLVGAVEKKGSGSIGLDAGENAGSGRLGVNIADNLKAVIDKADIIIDFTAPPVAIEHIRTSKEKGMPIVIGTTGFSGQELDGISDAARTIPVVLSPNMSVGINLIFKVIDEIAKRIGEDYDIEIIEAHHRLKKDAPSGTAMRMAQILARSRGLDLDKICVYSRKGIIGERRRGEIGIQTIRAGDIVGEHTVIFGGIGERIEVTHRSHSRDNFARGAIIAAKWLVGKAPGLYDMMDVLGLRAQ